MSTSLMEQTLAIDLLEEIFNRLDVRFVITTCAQVNRRWHEVVCNQKYWLQRCIRENIMVPPAKYRRLHQFNYARMCVHRPYGRNLILNPSGVDGHRYWAMDDAADVDRFHRAKPMAIESPPIGADNSPSGYCFATSYMWQSKSQTINFEEIGIERAVLDVCRPRLVVSEMYAARFDCAAEYDLAVDVSNAQEAERGESDEQDPMYWTIASTQHYELPQWNDRSWHEARIVLCDTLNGATRAVRMRSRAKDTQFWAGNFGMKMTEASVIVDFGEQDS